MPKRGTRNPPANRPRPSLPPGQTQTLELTPTPISKPPPPKQSSGLFNQVASTAAGVAVGTVVADAVTNSLFGGSEGGAVAAEPNPSAVLQQQQQQQAPPGTCSLEVQKFLKCAEGQSDLSQCRGYNDAVRQCRKNNNLGP
ncbi:coiled-coil-helix-coiled-coil-helix domain-containing protein 2-like [Homalodisca vitripennis]|uniref:coiled-coil-helix-coiled-coil-helix domain-containing protein 2-like n=1 Tax=Homalodisca vitripennis TaxID=197043 RepID=UPI001EEA6F56|nr:coiled-coil-helix-coiled-coil-helix domain-containing protein 2-like [Homalodisca vitripennis]